MPDDTAKPDNGTALAVRKPSAFEMELASYEPQLVAALPSHIPVERFKRVLVTAVNQNVDLAKADRRSLFTACVRAAQDGLLPDGREAALVIFGGKVQYLPMIHGIRKRMRNTGEVTAADAQVVFEKDHFDYELGDAPFIKHKPHLGERGRPVGAYAIIKLANGEILREVMSTADIEQVRKVSRAKDNGPWVTFWGEMARKTVLRRCSKAAPTSPDIEALLRRDDEVDVPDAPPQPALAEFQAEHTVEHVETPSESWPFVDGEGEEHRHSKAAEAVGELEKHLRACSALNDLSNALEAVETLWENNGELLTMLRETERLKTAEAIVAVYTEVRGGIEEAKAKAVKAEEERLAAAKKTDEEAKAKKAEQLAQRKAPVAKSTPAATQAAPAEKAPPAPQEATVDGLPKWTPRDKVPTSPLKGGNWIAWLGWFVDELRVVPLNQVPDLLSEENYGREYDYLAEKRPQDREAIDAIIENRKRAR